MTPVNTGGGEAVRGEVVQTGSDLIDKAGFWRHLFSFPAMLMAGLAVVAVLTVADRFNDPDLWFHLKLGQVVWTSHSIPSTDTFSFTAYGHAWMAHEWLTELSIYAAYRMSGYTGLMLWLVTLTSLLLILVFVLCYRYSGNALMSFVGGMCAWFFGTVGLAIRPQLLGYTFLVIELILLEYGSRNRRFLWALPPLFAVWVNCHGSYFFGLGLLGVYWLCSFANGKWGLVVAGRSDRQERRMLGAILILCGLALLCNPVGIRLLTYPLDVAFRQSTSMNAIDEWLPPDLRSPRGAAMIAVVIGIILIPLLRRSEVYLRDLLFVAVALALAMQHVRMLFVFGIVMSPVLCRMLAPLLGSDMKREHPIANAVFIAGFAVTMIVGFPSKAAIEQQIRNESPSAAVEYIRRTGLTGPMLNSYVFGDYLIWALPEEKVFIDGRGDIYDWNGVLAEYGRWTTLDEDPALLLNKYRIRFCLLSPGASMTKVLPYMPGWKKVYSDHVAVIFVR